MHSIRSFWKDEAGSVVSAEVVLIGAVAAVGVTAGVQTVSNTLDEEMRDVTRSIRNVNQSYSYQGFRGCGSQTAGSAFADSANRLPSDPPAKSPAKGEARKSARLSARPRDLADVAVEPAESDDQFIDDEQESLESEP